jgi:hypothetical protein
MKIRNSSLTLSHQIDTSAQKVYYRQAQVLSVRDLQLICNAECMLLPFVVKVLSSGRSGTQYLEHARSFAYRVPLSLDFLQTSIYKGPFQ